MLDDRLSQTLSIFRHGRRNKGRHRQACGGGEVAWLVGVWLVGAWLVGVWLVGAWLVGVWLVGAWLVGAWLVGVGLVGVWLVGGWNGNDNMRKYEERA